MKKKFLLTFAIVTVLFCLFAVGASAVTIYDDFDVTALENIEYRADDIVVFDDGFSCPSVYVFKDTKAIGKGQWSSPDGLKNVLDFTYINSKVAPKEYGFDDIDSLDIPQGVTSMGQYACNSLQTIRTISIPDTLVTFSGTCFQNASGLEYCIMEHSEASALTTLPGTMFSGSGLKAFSMPDCITTLPSGNEFGNCKSLTAVYLSKNLTSITGASGKSSCFDYCGKLYLVNEPFVATSEEQIPAKPSVYYFPSNLTALGTDSIGVFRGSNSINDVLVFGAKLTAIKSRVAFQNCPANTVVFLGDMTDVVAYEKYYWGTKNFIFANPNDKSASDLNNLALKSDQNAYFCYGDNASHLVEKQLSTKATCTSPVMTTDYCFCGATMSTNEVPNSALGHEFSVEKGATRLSIEYTNYLANGISNIKCARCEERNESEVAPIITEFKGFSVSEKCDAITFGYVINYEALDEFVKITGNDVELGFVVAVKAFAGNDAYTSDKAVKASVVTWTTDDEANEDVVRYTGADFILRGNWDDMVDLDGDEVAETDVKKVEFYMAGYIIVNGAVSYLNYGASGANAGTVTFEQASTVA